MAHEEGGLGLGAVALVVGYGHHEGVVACGGHGDGSADGCAEGGGAGGYAFAVGEHLIGESACGGSAVEKCGGSGEADGAAESALGEGSLEVGHGGGSVGLGVGLCHEHAHDLVVVLEVEELGGYAGGEVDLAEDAGLVGRTYVPEHAARLGVDGGRRQVLGQLAGLADESDSAGGLVNLVEE